MNPLSKNATSTSGGVRAFRCTGEPERRPAYSITIVNPDSAVSFVMTSNRSPS